MSNEAIRLLIFLQKNPNLPEQAQFKAKVNQLLQAPSVR